MSKILENKKEADEVVKDHNEKSLALVGFPSNKWKLMNYIISIHEPVKKINK